MIDWTLVRLVDHPLGFYVECENPSIETTQWGEGAQGEGNWRNSPKLNSFRTPYSWKRGDGGRRGPKFKHFLFVLFWAHCHRMAFSLLHRKEWIWHQRSQADNARKSVWLYVNISMCPRFPCCPRSRSLLPGHGAAWRTRRCRSSSSSTGNMVIYMLHFPHNSSTNVKGNYSNLVFKWPFL